MMIEKKCIFHAPSKEQKEIEDPHNRNNSIGIGGYNHWKCYDCEGDKYDCPMYLPLSLTSKT